MNQEENCETFYHPKYTKYGIEVYDNVRPVPFKVTGVDENGDFNIIYIRPSARMCDGYIGVCINTKPFHYYHRFIAECIENRELSSDEEVDHIDGVKHHNNLDNLQILSHSKNMKKVKKFNYHCFVTNLEKDKKEFTNLMSIVEYTDLSGPTIYAMLSGKIEGYAVNDNGGKFWFKKY